MTAQTPNEFDRTASEILERIRAFDRRRRRLLVQRGLCAFFLALIAAMVGVAVVDALLLLEDHVRLLLSLLAYATAGAVLWESCLRYLRRPPDERLLARWFESLKPDFREELLSAVELGGDRSHMEWDSPVFRTVLLRKVAERLQRTPVQMVLPTELVRRWWVGFAITVGTVAALSVIPPLRLPRRLARALAPLAPIDRVSRVEVRILEPRPPERIVPHGEIVPVVIECLGKPVETAVLEVIPSGARRGLAQAMRGVGNGRFASEIRVEREPVAYRIRAGDAMTRRYVIRTASPPRVERFVMEYRPPAYSGWPAKVVEGETGALEAIEGTTVLLTIHADQSLRLAEAHFEFNGDAVTVSLKKKDARTWQAEFPLARSGAYRLRLVSAETGFENRFSPTYPVEVRPDTAPIVTLVQPDQDGFVPADERLKMEARAEDDVALESIHPEVRINQGPWTPLETLSAEGGREFIGQARLALETLGVRTGDRLHIRWVARDRRGNQAESAVRQLTVSASGFERDRLRRLESLRAAVEVIERLDRAMREGGEKVRGFADILRRAATPTERRGTLAAAEQAIGRLRGAAEDIHQSLLRFIAETPDGLEADHLVRISGSVSRLAHSALAAATAMLRRLSAETDPPEMGARVEQVVRMLGEAETQTSALLAAAVRLRNGVGAEILYEDLLRLNEKQTRLLQSVQNDPRGIDSDAVMRLQTVISEHAREGLALANELAREAGKGAAETAARLADGLGRLGRVAQWAQEVNFVQDPLRLVRAVAERLRQDRPQGLRLVTAMRPVMEEAGERLRALAGSASEFLATTRRAAEQQAKDVDRLMLAAASHLRDRAAAEERRTTADGRFVRDLSLLAEAVEVAQSGLRPAGSVDWPTLESAARTIEAVHGLRHAVKVARNLAAEERWGPRDAVASYQRAALWRRTEAITFTAEKALEQANLIEVAQRVRDIMRSEAAERVRNAMRGRDGVERGDSVEGPAAEIAEALARILLEAEPAAETARRGIQQHTPALAERLETLARQAEEIRQKTEENRTPIAEVKREQNALAERVREAEALLRHEAGAQEWRHAEGRERARDLDTLAASIRRALERAEERLRAAEAVSRPEMPQAQRRQAAEAQAELRDALAQAAEHLRALDSGEAESTRAALRAAEESLGIRTAMEEHYGRLERLAELAARPAESLPQSLAEELTANPAMRQELARLAEQTAATAAEQLAQAAAQQQTVAQALNTAAQQNMQMAAQLAEQTRALAQQLDQFAGQTLPAAETAARAAQVDTQPLRQALQAAEALRAALPADATAPSSSAAQAVEHAAQAMAQAAEGLQQMAAQTAGATSPPAPSGAPSSSPSQTAQAAGAGQPSGQAGQPSSAPSQGTSPAGTPSAPSQSAQGAPSAPSGTPSASAQAAQEAAQIAQAAAQLASAMQPATAQAAMSAQAAIVAMTHSAAEQLAHAAQMAELLGQTDAAQALAQAAEGAAATAVGEVAQAAQAPVSQAVSAAEAAAQALAQRAAEAAQAAQMLLSSPVSGAAEPTGAWLARALEAAMAPAAAPATMQSALAAAASPAASSPSSTPSTASSAAAPSPSGTPSASAAAAGAMAAALQSAAAAQASQMAQARMGAPSSGLSQGVSGAALSGTTDSAALPADSEMERRRWQARLPPSVAREVLEAPREEVPEEYRPLVEAYFRSLAEERKR